MMAVMAELSMIDNFQHFIIILLIILYLNNIIKNVTKLNESAVKQTLFMNVNQIF